MVGGASDLYAVHARGLPRRPDAKTFRGDVSEKFQVRSNSSPYTFDWFISCAEFSVRVGGNERVEIKLECLLVLW
jgi:hypothetical protein